MEKSRLIRASEEFYDLLYSFMARCYAKGKKPPSIQRITKMIANNINLDKVIQNEFDNI